MRWLAIFVRFLIILLTYLRSYGKITAIFDYPEVILLNSVLYEFEAIDCLKQKNYIFQNVKNRKLTDIYHSHDFFEVILCLKGHGMQMINESEIACLKNGIFLFRPGDRHCFIRQSEDIQILSFSIKKEEFECFANAYDPYLLKALDEDTAPISFPCESDFFVADLQNATEYDCKLFLSFVLHAYITHKKIQNKGMQIPLPLSSAIESMKKKENLKMGIEAFTALSHYSQSHLARLIKAYFGISLKQYVNELRLQCAYNRIVLTNESAEEIAENVGFSSFSHFNKIFKKRFSTTPAALRKSGGAWTA